MGEVIVLSQVRRRMHLSRVVLRGPSTLKFKKAIRRARMHRGYTKYLSEYIDYFNYSNQTFNLIFGSNTNSYKYGIRRVTEEMEHFVATGSRLVMLTKKVQPSNMELFHQSQTLGDTLLKLLKGLSEEDAELEEKVKILCILKMRYKELYNLLGSSDAIIKTSKPAHL